ncbi:MAG: hypothetical protein IH892_16270 [Planctomycetes bacterium]|nr:hypothetical protein [Planctomycetota bacterium]
MEPIPKPLSTAIGCKARGPALSVEKVLDVHQHASEPFPPPALTTGFSLDLVSKQVLGWVLGIVVILTTVAHANWSESFDGGFDLTTWQFYSFPQVKNTYTQTLATTEGGNGYLVIKETTSVGALGAAFGTAFGSDEVFTDVRVGATVNVVGDASHNHHGLAARCSFIINDGLLVPGAAPGIIASCYVMHINWEDGPANLRIDIEKVINLQNIMREDIEVLVPALGNARSYYAELDVIGSGPVHVTGSLYEHKGGPLVVQTPTMVDTEGNDPWEDSGVNDAPLLSGQCGIFAQNENANPPGFLTTFDDVSSVSDGPAAVMPSPADGAIGVSPETTLAWTEAAFSTGRQLWFGGPTKLEPVDPAPNGWAFSPSLLRFGQSYQWRIDQIGPNGIVAGHTWEFTTRNGLPVDDFESYANSEEIAATWIHNIPGDFDYVFLETSKVSQGNQSMRFEYQNQHEPFFTEATRTFEQPKDWTANRRLNALALEFRGEDSNLEQQLYIRIEDAAGNQVTFDHPFLFAVQSEPWRSWERTSGLIRFSSITEAGLDITAVKSLTIGVGDGTSVDAPTDAFDTIYIDDIVLVLLVSSRSR